MSIKSHFVKSSRTNKEATFDWSFMKKGGGQTETPELKQTGTPTQPPSTQKTPSPPSLQQESTSLPSTQKPPTTPAVQQPQSFQTSTETGLQTPTQTIASSVQTTQEQPQDLWKKLALIFGVPLGIASLGHMAIRGFNMSNLVGLGLGAVASLYGMGLLDYVFSQEKREQLIKQTRHAQFRNRNYVDNIVRKIFGEDTRPRDISAWSKVKTDPGNIDDAFIEAVRTSQKYISSLFENPREYYEKSPYIYGFTRTFGWTPETDLLDQTRKGRYLNKALGIILLAKELYKIEREGGDPKQTLLQLLSEKSGDFGFYTGLSTWHVADPAKLSEYFKGNLMRNNIRENLLEFGELLPEIEEAIQNRSMRGYR